MVIALVLATRTEAQISTLKEELSKAQKLASEGSPLASGAYTDLMVKYPGSKEAVQGWLMINMKRSPTGEEEAIGQLEELQKQYPENTGILFFKSFLQVEKNLLNEALTGFDRLTTLQPDSAVNWVAKGQILASLNKDEDALPCFEKASKLDPKRFDIWGMQADALLKLSKLDEAITAYNRAVDLAPGYPVFIYNRGCAYCRKGDKINALADLKRAIAIDSQFRISASRDEDFRSLWEDQEFKALISQ
jgi:tetratricopeptide (TPR) repeat protein